MLVAEVVNSNLERLTSEEIVTILNDYRHPMFEQVYDLFVDSQRFTKTENRDE